MLTDRNRAFLYALSSVAGGLRISQLRPSARAMAKRLRAQGYVSKRNFDIATVTEKGRKAARSALDGDGRG